METIDAAAPPLPPRIALISILAFWALYFAILTFRAVAIYNDHYGLDSRAVVVGASVGITFLIYLVLRRVPIARLGLCIAVAALLSAPAAILYSTVNYYAFLHSMMEKEGYEKPATAPPGPGPATPVAPPAMTVGTMDEDHDISALAKIGDQAGNGYFFFASPGRRSIWRSVLRGASSARSSAGRRELQSGGPVGGTACACAIR
jgi:hypothetical protein